MNAPCVRALGWHAGWGPGIVALPADAHGAAAGRAVVPWVGLRSTPSAAARATRDCLWGVAAVGAMLEDGEARREAIAGDRTALIYVTAAAYAASNRAFIEAEAAPSTFRIRRRRPFRPRWPSSMASRGRSRSSSGAR